MISTDYAIITIKNALDSQNCKAIPIKRNN